VEGAFGLKRGEIWTIAGGADYAGKPRPAIIVQSDAFDATPSVTICPLSGTPVVDTEPVRFEVTPSQANGLHVTSQVMVDKISTLPRSKLGRRIGRLESADVSLLNRSVALFLGLAE
jgi:mRNA interferase MazF